MLQQAGGQCAPVLRIASPEEVEEPPKNWRRCFPFHHKGRDPSPHVRDALLVICALIATVTFQAGISPPSHIFQVRIKPAMSPSRVAMSPSPVAMPPSLEEDVSEKASMVSLTVFLVANSIALSTSFSIIDYLRRGLPFRRELRVMMFFVMFAYGWSMAYTRPSGLLKNICLGFSLGVPVFISLISDLVNE